SMIDEYRPGDMIFVDPEVPACHGDDVIALMHDTGETTFKRLIVEFSSLSDDELRTRFLKVQDADSNPWRSLQDAAFKRTC
ncbi:S24 family peptidase, partial [Escherichia coli]|uniref:S24 family peptidase n=1 Tax=Escherichia coli TaxID=562 RepID=UPI003EE2410A